MIKSPAKSKMAFEIRGKEGRVRVSGTIVSIDAKKGQVIVDDGSASVDVFLNNQLVEKLNVYKQGDQIIVMGRENEKGIDCEILRKIEGFEPSRYKQVLEVWRNVRSENE